MSSATSSTTTAARSAERPPRPLSRSQARVLDALSSVADPDLVGDPPHVVTDEQGAAHVPGYGRVPAVSVLALMRRGLLVDRGRGRYDLSEGARA